MNRTAWPRWMLCVALLLALPDGRMLRAEDVFLSTLYEPEQVRQVLVEIRDGYRRNQALLSSMRMGGRLQPGNREFVLTQHNGRVRFDREVDHPQRGRIWLGCLDTGHRFFQMWENRVFVIPKESKKIGWHELCDELTIFTTDMSLDDESRRQDVAQLCELLCDMIRGNGKYKVHQAKFHAGEISIALQHHWQDNQLGTWHIIVSNWNGFSWQMTVDADQGYQMVYQQEFQINPEPSRFVCSETIQNTYFQLANGAWVLNQGQFARAERGTITAQEGRPEWWSKSIAVDYAEILEEQDLDEDCFKVSSLPLPPKYLVIEQHEGSETVHSGQAATEFIQQLTAEADDVESEP